MNYNHLSLKERYYIDIERRVEKSWTLITKTMKIAEILT